MPEQAGNETGEASGLKHREIGGQTDREPDRSCVWSHRQADSDKTGPDICS